MKIAALVALVTLVSLLPTSGLASTSASTPTLSAGGGRGHVLERTRDVIWSEPPDLEGLIASSEVIGQYALESEIANDFFSSSEHSIGTARWWGGYYNNSGCSDTGYATNWNLRFYNDGGCTPGTVISEHIGVHAYETFVYCQADGYPEFQYEASLCGVPIAANTRYWFGAQACDHTYPPQVGRLSSAGVLGCNTAFRGAYFGYPDWTPGIDVFGVNFDASQEFEEVSGGGGACCLPDGSCVVVSNVYCGDWLHGELHACLECEEVTCDPPQACCFVGGFCAMVTDWGCRDQHGEPQGAGTVCSPSPCEPVSVGCIDYATYPHWQEAVNLPAIPGGVAISGVYICVADGEAGLQIIDPSPGNSHIVGAVDTPGSALGVAAFEAYAYVADGGFGLQLIDISDPVHPAIVGNLAAGTTNFVASAGKLAYITGPDFGFEVVEVANPQQPHVVGQLSGLYGSIAITDRYAFVADGALLQVVDIEDPSHPQIIGSVDTPGSAVGVAAWGALALVADGSSGLSVVDVSNPLSPVVVGNIETTDDADAIAAMGTHAYVADHQGLSVIDFADPTHPRLSYRLDSWDSDDPAVTKDRVFFTSKAGRELLSFEIMNPEPVPILGGLVMPSDPVDMALGGDFAYVGDGVTGLVVVDVKDPRALQVVGSLDTSGTAGGVAIRGDVAFVADGEAGILIISIEDPRNPHLIASVQTPAQTRSLAVLGDYLYAVLLSSGYDPDILVAIKIADPESPRIVGSLQMPYYARDVAVSGSYAYVTGGSNILQVVDISDPEGLETVGFVDGFWYPEDTVVVGDYLYAASGGGGLQVFAISDPTGPQVVATIDTGSRAYSIDAQDGYVYLADVDTGLYLFDLAVPSAPRLIGNRDMPVYCDVVRVGGNRAYVVDSSNLLVLPAQCGLAAVTDPAAPVARLGLRAYPNPASGPAAIRIDLAADCVVRATIHDVGGRLVRNLQNGIMTAGPHELSWDARDDAGQPVAAGVYVARVSALGTNSSARVVIVR